MEIPDDYPDALTDELAPYGFEFAAVSDDEEGGTIVLFEAEPESFVRAYPLLGIEESLEQFLESERREDLPSVLKEAEAEARRLTGELEALIAVVEAGEHPEPID